MSIKTRLSKMEQASQPKRALPPLEVHYLTRDAQDGWTYDSQPVSDAEAVAIARRQTHRNHFVIIRNQGDPLPVEPDIILQRAYGNTA